MASGAPRWTSTSVADDRGTVPDRGDPGESAATTIVGDADASPKPTHQRQRP
jgi:hypothetical protein